MNYYIDNIYQSKIEVQKSVFINFLIPVKDNETIKKTLKNMRKEYPKASHYVYAFRLYLNNQITEGLSDDGEPSNTSAKPMLSVLRSYSLINILLISIRYFGGIKLGKGGLVRAYTKSAKSVIENANLIQNISYKNKKIYFEYSQYDQIKYHLNLYQVKIIKEEFREKIFIEFLYEDKYEKDIEKILII